MALNDHLALRLGRRVPVAQGALPAAMTCGFAGGADDLEWQ